MGLVDDWREIEAALPENWADARLLLTVADDADAAHAAALLGPVGPGRHGRAIRFATTRGGAGPAPATIRRLLAGIDAQRIEGTLALQGSGESVAAVPTARTTLTEAWDAATASLPPDWSDLLCEVELASTDHLERAALMLSPANPSRFGPKPALRFRCSHTHGYGVSGAMARRCLARLDELGIRGTVQILRSLSDTYPVGSQGPVWYVGGRAV
jgi:hypothetical protein